MLTWLWYLLEDFSEQNWFMKAFIAWGWLCILIMAWSLVDPFLQA